MLVTTQRLTAERDGIPGFLAFPKRDRRGPGLLWVHHNHGLTDELRELASDYAALGYTCVIPNLYQLVGIKGVIHPGQGQDIQKVTSDPKFVGAIRKGWRFLRARKEVDPDRIGVIGYCMGGRLGVQFVADTPSVRAFAAYYPSIKDEPETAIRPRHGTKAVRRIRCPTIVIFGGRDTVVPNSMQLEIWKAFLDNGQPLEWHFYSEGFHGFCAPASEGYQPSLARRVEPLVASFLARQLSLDEG